VKDAETENLQKTFKLRKFTTNDLRSVVHVNAVCLPENYTDFFFIELHQRFPDTFIVAEENDEVVGYIMCRMEYGLSNFGFKGLSKKGHIVSVAVMPDFRRKGIGEALVNEATNGMQQYGAKQAFLEVRVTNEPAVDLYKKLRFEIARTVNGYYADGEDAYVMTKKL